MNDIIPKTKIMCFAYGSNMYTDRMRSRVPSATVVGPAKLPDKRLVCSKKSKDGSGKANLADSPGDPVWGVLYEVDLAELDRLDRAEGGYQRTSLQVWARQGSPVTAEVYVSTELTADPVPYESYKELIVAGAREHKLPRDYVEYLEQLPSKPDPSRNKPT